MKRLLSTACVALGVLVVSVGSARAQFYGQQLGQSRFGSAPFQRPTLSPYLSLGQGGNPALNYYNAVRPLQNQQVNTAAIGLLSQQVAANQQNIGGLQYDVNGLTVTGHQVRFLNYHQYFLNLNATVASQATGATGTTTTLGNRNLTTGQLGGTSASGLSQQLRPTSRARGSGSGRLY
jgi:hypothetical protein